MALTDGTGAPASVDEEADRFTISLEGKVVGRIQARRESTTSRTRSAACAGSSCSHTLTLTQPASASRASVSRSRARIPVDLVGPELRVGRGDGVVLGAAVPEAPVEEDRDLRRREDEIGGATKPRQRPRRDTVAKTQAVDGRSQRQLGFGVPAAVGTHASARLRRGCPRFGHVSSLLTARRETSPILHRTVNTIQR